MELDQIQEIIKLRHKLHQHPELPFAECQTARRLNDFVARYHPRDIVRNLGGHGLAVVFNGRQSGPTVMIRGDMDALPIIEISTTGHQSQAPGVSHACGHDGHMAIVAGLAPLVSAQGLAKGRLVLLFQPAEENLKGAKRVIADPRFEQLHPDYAFALHNMPGYRRHRIVFKDGTMLAAVRTIIIKLFGKTAHASTPQQGISPLSALKAIEEKITAAQQRDRSSPRFSLATVVGLTVGENPSYGVLPADGTLIATLRAYDDRVLDDFCTEIETAVKEIAGQENLRIEELSYDEACAATVNSPAGTEIVRAAAERNQFVIEQMGQPVLAGEDFGEIIRVSRLGGAMFFVGNGIDTPGLHNPDFDFPDELIETGVAMFGTIIEALLGWASVP